MREEFVDPQYRPEDHIEQADETGLRPKSLDEFVGQRELKEHLGIVLEAARRRGQAADHILLAGPPGLGKTTMASIVASEMNAHIHITSGPALERAGVEPEKEVRNNLEAMRLISELEQGKHARTLEFQFLCTPTQFRGNGKVEEVVFTTSAGEEKVIKCGLVITAIGYEADPLAGIPYEKGKVLNTDGRVGESVYVVGWAKRGPSGVIGTNKSDAADVMNLLLADMKEPKPAADLSSLITTNKVISQSNWESINAAEIAAGEPHGKPRIKAVSREELLRLGGL